MVKVLEYPRRRIIFIASGALLAHESLHQWPQWAFITEYFTLRYHDTPPEWIMRHAVTIQRSPWHKSSLKSSKCAPKYRRSRKMAHRPLASASTGYAAMSANPAVVGF
jgi:hypothetical protein